MPPAATETVASDAAMSETSAPYLSTMPDNDFGWQITLAQKVVVITGANRGIGLGIAEVCLANSAKMVYSFDLMEPGEDFAALQKRYPNFRFIQTDVTSEESVEKAINLVIEETGRIDGLVANAGMTKHQPALKFDRPELEKLFNLNVSPTDGFSSMTCFSRIASGLRRLFLCSDRRSQVHRARHQGLYRYDI
jgi:NAD(P)-dependent dehydrogenase (short-subunit alcohol dehydrogenase family)